MTTFTPFEQQVRRFLAVTPSMLATVLAERVGWTGSATWFRQNVALMAEQASTVRGRRSELRYAATRESPERQTIVYNSLRSWHFQKKERP